MTTATGEGLLSTATIEQRHRTGLVAALADGWTIGKRNLKHFTRLPRLLVFSTIQPVMFVLLFGYVFDGAVRGSLPDGFPTYLSFVLPGIFIQSTVFRMTQTAVGLADDLEKGVIDRFRSLPMSRAGVLLGRTIADLARSTAVILLMVIFGVLVGFRFDNGLWGGVGSVLIVGVLGYALSWVFVYVALMVPGPNRPNPRPLWPPSLCRSCQASLCQPPVTRWSGWPSSHATRPSPLQPTPPGDLLCRAPSSPRLCTRCCGASASWRSSSR